jgi:uncharacterized protein
VLVVNAAHPLDPVGQLTDLDVVAWQAGDELSQPLSDEPEYRRALFNTEAAWRAASNCEVAR